MNPERGMRPANSLTPNGRYAIGAVRRDEIPAAAPEAFATIGEKGALIP
ncbi:hypothetical protein [Streptomyces sp. NPDC059957]